MGACVLSHPSYQLIGHLGFLCAVLNLQRPRDHVALHIRCQFAQRVNLPITLGWMMSWCNCSTTLMVSAMDIGSCVFPSGVSLLRGTMPDRGRSRSPAGPCGSLDP